MKSDNKGIGEGVAIMQEGSFLGGVILVFFPLAGCRLGGSLWYVSTSRQVLRYDMQVLHHRWLWFLGCVAVFQFLGTGPLFPLVQSSFLEIMMSINATFRRWGYSVLEFLRGGRLQFVTEKNYLARKPISWRAVCIGTDRCRLVGQCSLGGIGHHACT